jgi:phosphohistidine phosphatase
MKKLYLFRHAKSKSQNFNESDFIRSLSESGKNEALLMGQKLFALNNQIDFFVSSPALRARQTCEILCNCCKYSHEKISFEENLYLPDTNALAKTISTINNLHNNIVLVSHNPGITEFINLLQIGVRIDEMPTCGMFVIKVDSNNWSSFFESEKQFLYFDYPTNVQRSFSK